MDAIAHGAHVLALALSGSPEACEAMRARLSPAHFTDPQQRVLFELSERYLDWTGQPLPASALEDLLRAEPPGTALQYAEYHAQLMALPPSGADISWHIDQLRELSAQRLTGEALAQSMEILTRGAWSGQERLQGHQAAREHAQAAFAALDASLRLTDSPEGDLRAEAQELLADYQRRADSASRGDGVIATGVPRLDQALGGGLQRGEVALIAGYTSVGKTALACAWAWDACVAQGKNVVFFTSETLRAQIRFKMIARHSRASRVWKDSFPTGLNSKDLKAGTLPPEAIPYLIQTVKHFADNPAHGRCHIAQVPRGATVATIEARLTRLSRVFRADLVIIDYLALLRSDRKRQSSREELAETVKEAKQVAATYLNGRGVPLVSPWQVNREGWKEAKARHFYTTADLAETAEASSTADLIVGLLEDGEDTSAGRSAPVRLGVVKNRDGERLREAVPLTVDYATAYFAPRDSAVSELAAFGGDAPI